jgi:hypothetical protein
VGDEHTLVEDINRLVGERQKLRGGTTTDADRERLAEIETAVARCWDDIRKLRVEKRSREVDQRRAARRQEQPAESRRG